MLLDPKLKTLMNPMIQAKAWPKMACHALVEYIIQPSDGYHNFATVAHVVAEPSTGTSANVRTTDARTKLVYNLVYVFDLRNSGQKNCERQSPTA